jgi:retron-type reverse transcriptase
VGISLADLVDLDDLARDLSVRVADLQSIAQTLPQYYRRKEKVKPDGRRRTFYIPHGDLKNLQGAIAKKLLAPLPLHQAIHSYRKGKSTLTNARVHLGHPFMVKLDIEDYFPSISRDRVFRLLGRLGFSGPVARTLAVLTTFKNQLPQGAPTSQAIANLVFDEIIKKRISPLCETHKLEPSVYGDDLTISGSKRLVQLKHLVERIIEDEGFKVSTKPSKNQLLLEHDQKVVTGYVLKEDKLDVKKSRYREVRAIIHNCLKNGGASQFDCDVKTAKEQLRGKIEYIRKVNPVRGNTLLRDFKRITWP